MIYSCEQPCVNKRSNCEETKCISTTVSITEDKDASLAMVTSKHLLSDG